VVKSVAYERVAQGVAALDVLGTPGQQIDREPYVKAIEDLE